MESDRIEKGEKAEGMTEQEICKQFGRVMQRIGKVSSELAFGNLTQNEFFALNIIRGFEEEHQDVKGIYVSTLGMLMKSSMPAVSRLLRTMEGKGLLERVTDPQDRRNTYVFITEQGEETRTKGMKQMGNLFLQVLRQMGSENMVSMLKLMQEYADIMEDKVKEMKKHV